MGADHAFAMLELAADLGRGDRRAVAGEDGIRLNDRLEIGEDLLLERQFLRRRLDHQHGVLDGGHQLIVHGDVLETGRIIVQQFGDHGESLGKTRAQVGDRLEDADRMAGGGEAVGDAVAHQPGADHADFFFRHGPLPCLISRRCNRHRHT